MKLCEVLDLFDENVYVKINWSDLIKVKDVPKRTNWTMYKDKKVVNKLTLGNFIDEDNYEKKYVFIVVR